MLNFYQNLTTNKIFLNILTENFYNYKANKYPGSLKRWGKKKYPQSAVIVILQSL